MDLVKITDEQGNALTFKRYNGRGFHPLAMGNVRDQLTKITDYKCRSDDVILCSFPKSGTHWVYNMVEMLRTGTLQYTGTPLMMAFRDLHEIDALKTPRTYVTHLSYPLIPNDAKDGKVKLVFLMRNPKDTAVSYYKFFETMADKEVSYEGNFDGFLRFYLSEEFVAAGASWFRYLKEWEEAKRSNKNLKILCLHYEDLQQNLYDNIVKLSNFLEVNHADDFLRDVERSVLFRNLKKAHDTEKGETEKFKEFAEGGRLPIYRKGVIGDWKKMFTVAQNERFDSFYRERMKEIGLSENVFLME